MSDGRGVIPPSPRPSDPDERDTGYRVTKKFAADHVALITGAAGDIGRAVAWRLASEGASVVLADLPRAAERLEETRRGCASRRRDEAFVATTFFDVTAQHSARDAIADVVDGFGVPNLVFNNAGYQGEFGNIADVDEVDANSVIQTNVIGVLNVLQAVAHELRHAMRPGRIVNTASMAGVVGAPNMAVYSASKAAVIGLTKAAAKDLAPLGIRVNAVSPGFIGPGTMWDNQVRQQALAPSIYYADDEATVAGQMIDQIPLRRYGSLEEVAATVSFLLSDDSSYLTGQNIEIAGGAK